jgi:hypothetical protein
MGTSPEQVTHNRVGALLLVNGLLHVVELRGLEPLTLSLRRLRTGGAQAGRTDAPGVCRAADGVECAGGAHRGRKQIGWRDLFRVRAALPTNPSP